MASASAFVVVGVGSTLRSRSFTAQLSRRSAARGRGCASVVATLQLPSFVLHVGSNIHHALSQTVSSFVHAASQSGGLFHVSLSASQMLLVLVALIALGYIVHELTAPLKLAFATPYASQKVPYESFSMASSYRSQANAPRTSVAANRFVEAKSSTSATQLRASQSSAVATRAAAKPVVTASKASAVSSEKAPSFKPIENRLAAAAAKRSQRPELSSRELDAIFTKWRSYVKAPDNASVYDVMMRKHKNAVVVASKANAKSALETAERAVEKAKTAASQKDAPLAVASAEHTMSAAEMALNCAEQIAKARIDSGAAEEARKEALRATVLAEEATMVALDATLQQVADEEARGITTNVVNETSSAAWWKKLPTPLKRRN